MGYAEYPRSRCKERSCKHFLALSSCRAGKSILARKTPKLRLKECEKQSSFFQPQFTVLGLGKQLQTLKEVAGLSQPGPGTVLLRDMLVSRPHTGPSATNHHSAVELPLDLQHCQCSTAVGKGLCSSCSEESL